MIVEIVLLAVVGFLPADWKMLANALVSFSCALQVQTFRKVNGHPFSSTMYIGNIHNGMEALYHHLHHRSDQSLKKTACYFGVIFFFAVGAGLGGGFNQRYGLHTIWFSCVLLLIGLMMMFIRKEDE